MAATIVDGHLAAGGLASADVWICSEVVSHALSLFDNTVTGSAVLEGLVWLVWL